MATEPDRKFKFHFVKSNFYRVIHVDGAWGGMSPKGNIQISVFNERTPIPREVTHEMIAEGDHYSLGKEVASERVGKDGVVREVEADLVLSIDTAEGLYHWLGNKLKEIKALKGDADKKSR